jgi:hypothetical protein
MNCWQCGVEPLDVVEVSSLDGLIRQIPHWPSGDHVHAVQPPTPDRLGEAGHEALRRLLEG